MEKENSGITRSVINNVCLSGPKSFFFGNGEMKVVIRGKGKSTWRLKKGTSA